MLPKGSMSALYLDRLPRDTRHFNSLDDLPNTLRAMISC